MPDPKSVHLFFKEGSSDKEYRAQLVESAGGWDVNFQYGRRGAALTGGTKIAGAPYDKALKIYDKLVAEKTGKGYTPDQSGAVFTAAAFAGRATEFRAQLLNEITVDEARALGRDWLVGQKHDGERRGVIITRNNTVFTNRDGLEVGVDARLPKGMQVLHDSLMASEEHAVDDKIILDGEDLGDKIVIFDVIRMPGTALGALFAAVGVPSINENSPFEDRAMALQMLSLHVDTNDVEGIDVEVPMPADVFFATGRNQDLLENGAEGFVMRHAKSLNRPGRPASGGDALKIKFWASCTAKVSGQRDGKRSVAFELCDDDGVFSHAGHVTVPANQEIPEPGSLIEVKYLYAFRGGSLFEPTLKGLRNDLHDSDCRWSQIKYKAEPVAEEEPSPGF